ncbi:uncharacterized protein LOC142348228 [Convolutriloba macropyga]|uniref:uncharacterized protein LOC142348228 n=1 Tax=Convolutriloba macropyga TaxID=536237 RepID=UPI003F520A6E
MSWLSPHMKRPWRQPNNPSYSPNNRPWSGNSPRFNSPREAYHYQSNSPRHAPYPRFSPRASFNQGYRNNSPRFSERSTSSISSELTGGYRSQHRFQQQFDKHDPFFHPSMLENPWAGLEEDFEEVREDLLENAEELILTIPMTISNWMRKIPLDNEMRENMSHDQKVNPNATGDVRSIAKLADTVNQIEQQLKSDGLYAQRHNAETKDTEQPEIKVEQKLLQPSDFEMEQHSSLPDNSNETIDQTETLSVSIDNSSPLRPSMFNRKSINDSISSIQSPPKMSSQPATPDRVVKPHPVIPQE